MSRPGKTIEFHTSTGNQAHLTSTEIQRRQDSEIKLGEKKFRCPQCVMQNKTAKRKWNDLIKIFQADEKSNVTSADIGIIERYCMMYADLQDAYTLRAQKVSSTSCSKDLFSGEDIITADLAELNVINTVITKLSNEMGKLEDRIFLNPLARLKNIPAKTEKKVDPLTERGFANV